MVLMMQGNMIPRPSSVEPPARLPAAPQQQEPDPQTLQLLLALLMMMQGQGGGMPMQGAPMPAGPMPGAAPQPQNPMALMGGMG